MLPFILCTRFITFDPSSYGSYALIGSYAAAPYFFGAEGYGACYGLFDTAWLYFFSCLVIYMSIEIPAYFLCILSP